MQSFVFLESLVLELVGGLNYPPLGTNVLNSKHLRFLRVNKQDLVKDKLIYLNGYSQLINSRDKM